MTRDKITALLQGLKAGTEQSKLNWQDLPDEEMFRTHVGHGMVRIGKLHDGDEAGYSLWILSSTGAIATQLDIRLGEPDYKLIEDVYSLARLASRGGNSLLDSMLRQLPTVAAG